MSKIQDALKRIQGSVPQNRPVRPTPDLPLANVDNTVTLRSFSSEDLPAAFRHAHPEYGGGLVEIDYKRLEEAGFLVSGRTQTRLADEFRTIKRPLLASVEGKKVTQPERANLLMVASSLPGEGKTFTCINLALSIAREKDWSVVLVDADCNRQHLSNLFSASQEVGLLDVLKDESLTLEDAIMPTNVGSLSILPGGNRDELSVELIASSRMTELFDRFCEEDQHRIVIFDTSPVLLTAEPATLSSRVGQVVFVIQAGKTLQSDVVSALARLDKDVATNAVLNQTEYGMGQSSGDYYGYFNDQDAPQDSGDEAKK